MVFEEDVVGELVMVDGPVKRVGDLRARTSEDGVSAHDVVGAW